MRLSWPWSYAVALLACASKVLGSSDVGMSEKEYSELKMIPLRTHSLNAPYLDSYMQSRWFDFGGDTVVRTDSYIRLAGELPSRTGWVFSRVPLTATNWEIEIEFKIHGSASLYGDGMAIWLTKQRAQTGPVFGFMDKFEGLGIFIDTYKNNRPGTVFPYIMAMMGDGNTAYDKEHDGKANELAGCPYVQSRNNDYPTKMKILYIHDRTLEVRLQSSADDSKWDLCFTLPNVKIPAVAYLGFSAETGELSDNHDIISVNARNIVVPDSSSRGATAVNQNQGKSRGQKGQRSSSGGWGWTVIKFFVFGFFLVGVYAVYTAYRTQRSRSRF